MKCLLCSIQFLSESMLKRHYINHHCRNEDDVHYKNLFEPDTLDKTCRICRTVFDSLRTKKKHMFLFHYLQTGGSGGRRTSDLPLNILRRGPITYYSINFGQHKNFYDFFSTDVVDIFLNNVYQVYQPNKENKIQGYAEIIKQQRGEIVLENKKVWLANVYRSKHFNDFVRD